MQLAAPMKTSLAARPVRVTASRRPAPIVSLSLPWFQKKAQKPAAPQAGGPSVTAASIALEPPVERDTPKIARHRYIHSK